MEELRDFTGLTLNIDPTKDGWDCKRRTDEFSSDLDGKPIDGSNIGKHKEQLSIHEIEYINEKRYEIEDVLKNNVFFD